MTCLLFQTTVAIKAKLCRGVYNKSKHAQKIHMLASMFAHTYVQKICVFVVCLFLTCSVPSFSAVQCINEIQPSINSLKGLQAHWGGGGGVAREGVNFDLVKCSTKRKRN